MRWEIMNFPRPYDQTLGVTEHPQVAGEFASIEAGVSAVAGTVTKFWIVRE